MKQIALTMLCVLLLFFCSACGAKKQVSQNENPSVATETSKTTNNEGSSSEVLSPTPVATLAPSDNKEVVTAETAPAVYWAMEEAYHLENCSELKGKEYEQVSWETVEMIGLRQCPVCDPPRYESYIEN